MYNSNIGNSLKILINPKFIIITKVVNPNITPNICGTVFANPKLNAEYEAIKLLGPGEKAAAEQNNTKAIKSESNIETYAIFKPFLVG